LFSAGTKSRSEMTQEGEQAEELMPARSHRALKPLRTAGASRGCSEFIAGKGRRQDDRDDREARVSLRLRI